ncbi:MAG: hydroxymethylglutaryl-CoA reductase, degradative [Thermoplasmata archaeon HGW-Thermoplasmata-1]|nr:MAG: hydroxymethylglutaryl-CoA reductase, degradative [Thermoplasmata archaeon HGW-Thermoplasmata-1]
MEKGSDISGFCKLSIHSRHEKLKELCGLDDGDIKGLFHPIDVESADRFIENAVGVMGVPLGIATNFLIDGRDYLIPMATEEPSIVAAASKAAKMARALGGFTTQVNPPVMIGQIELRGVKSFRRAKAAINGATAGILAAANECDPKLVKAGGGALGIELRKLSGRGAAVAHLLVDVRDAMGANAVNTMCEKVAPLIAEAARAIYGLRILSNLADRRIAMASATFSAESLGGNETVDAIIAAYRFAKVDPYRAATHNKGIMNGIDAVLLASGNDWRAVEAGAHAYAARSGRYEPLTEWKKDANGDLAGRIELPLSVGIVGGSIRENPAARACIKMLGVKSASELSAVAAAVGLAQNLAAMRALAGEGIQAGHMRLHARKAQKP